MKISNLEILVNLKKFSANTISLTKERLAYSNVHKLHIYIHTYIYTYLLRQVKFKATKRKNLSRFHICNKCLHAMESKLIWIIAIFYSTLQHISSASSPLKRPRAGDPFDTFPKNFWQEFSSPFTDTPEDEEAEITETTTHEPFPFFADPYTTVNVSTQLSSNVHLHCRVNDLQGKTVSWMRRKGDELALITFGLHTYSGDARYSLEFEEPNDWKLSIQYANEHDEGPYECQVSSHPPLVLLVYLTVIVPHVEILDERDSATPEKYYKAGSTIELKCVISKIPQPSSYITWQHGKRMLNYDTSRGGISVKTDMLPGRALSRLYIANANRQDTGNYTCMLGNDISGTVMVHVLNGEEPAAMQHASGAKLCSPISIVIVTMMASKICLR